MTPADAARLAKIRARLGRADEMAAKWLGGPVDDDMGFLLRLVDELKPLEPPQDGEP